MTMWAHYGLHSSTMWNISLFHQNCEILSEKLEARVKNLILWMWNLLDYLLAAVGATTVIL